MQDDDEAAFDAELAALANGSAQVGPFPLPHWVKGGSVEQPAIDGYVCDDPQAMHFALGVLVTTTGFGIPDYDEWLVSLGECGAQRELRMRRELAERALRENNQEVMRRHLEWMYLRRIMIDSGLAKTELAGIGEAVKRARSKGGLKSAAARQVSASAKHAEWVTAAFQLLAQGKSRRDLAGIIATRFNVTAKPVRDALKKAGVK